MGVAKYQKDKKMGFRKFILQSGIKEDKTLEEMKEIEKIGDVVRAVAQGYIQSKVSRQAYEFEKAV